MTAPPRWAEARARRGMVATPQALASEAGLAVLQAGGNAPDAAIAAAVTIAVVYPHMNGIGAITSGSSTTVGRDGSWTERQWPAATGAALDTYRRRGRAIPAQHPERLAAERFVQEDLAATLALVAAGGADEFYRGDLARRIAAGAAACGSPLSVEDLAEHRADWVEPLRVAYRAGEAARLPPPTQGFAALAILALLEGFGLGALDEADYVHVVVEATKLAFEDRDRYLADPTVVPVPVERCLDPARLEGRRARISRRATMPGGGVAAGGDTIAIVAADAAGNAVSVIPEPLPRVRRRGRAADPGVLLQNRGAFFSLDPAHPNCLAPRKRPGHTLIPCGRSRSRRGSGPRSPGRCGRGATRWRSRRCGRPGTPGG